MYKHEIIAEQIRENIQSKTLLPNQKLPSLREIATTFSTSIGTVVEAYNTLERENFIYSIPKKGYFVLGRSVPSTEQKLLIDFYSGAPDIRYIPYQDFRQCINKANNLYYKELFSYSNAQGMPELLSALQKHLADYQVHTKEENIVVVSGSQQVLDILVRMPFPNGKQTILVEQPTYYGMLKNLELSPSPRIGIMRGPNGLNFDELERFFRYDNIKFFYTVPRYHNPTGQSYNKKERETLVALADKYNVYIVEDDIAADFETDSKRDPLFYSDIYDKVIYIKSFSKILMPGLRLAAVVLPTLLMNNFLNYKQWTDTYSAILSQGALTLFLGSGMYQKNRREIQKIYMQRMKKLKEVATSLDTNGEIEWDIPDSGFFACMRLQKGIAFERVQPEFYKNNIRMMDTRNFFLDEFKNDCYYRLSLGHTNEEEIEYGATKLTEIFMKHNRQKNLFFIENIN